MTSDRFNLLYRLSQRMTSSLNLDEVLNGVMDEVIAVTRAERGFIMLLSEHPPAEKTFVDSRASFEIHTARGIDRSTIEGPAFQVSRGVVEQVAREGEPILTSDAQKDDRLSARESVVLKGLHAILCVPLKTKQKTLGVIYVDNRVKSGVFTQADMELLSTIAVHAAASIENARLFGETQERLLMLHTLYEIAADLASSLDLQVVLTNCLERVQSIFDARAASILTVEGQELFFRVAIGEKAEQIKPFRIPLGHGIAGWVVEHGQGLVVNDARADPRFYATTDAETGFVTECLLAAPLTTNDRTIGVIEVFNKAGGFSKADLDLLTAIASSAAIAIENARLYQAAVEKGRLESELQFAREVQTSLLPTIAPSIPGWEFAYKWEPARQVSGDFYDFIHLPAGLLGLVVADVAGKGMPAAVFMAFTRSVMRASIENASSPLGAIEHANCLICTDATRGLFSTLFYAQLDPAQHALTYVNAGHNPPLFYQAATQALTPLLATGYPLGVEPDAVYTQQSIQLCPNDFIVLYTDGVTEAMSPQEELFSQERLEQLLLKNRTASAKGLLSAIEHSLNSFITNKPRSDDITIVIIKRVA
ncbi:MAG TPA: SpoIIE family protein phosphatase [Anaerolineales bacterium]|nr:SpoIIE family protein phosphatase [Anaerolineales bacterium]